MSGGTDDDASDEDLNSSYCAREYHERASGPDTLQLHGALPCLSERVIFEKNILTQQDIEEVEGSIRTVLKCDFGACAALHSAAYTRARLNSLRALRDTTGVVCVTQRIHMSPTMVVEVRWNPLQMLIIECPRQTLTTVVNANNI